MVNEDVDTDYGRKYSCDHAKTELETILKAIKPDLLIIDQRGVCMVNEDVDTDYGRKYSCDHAKTELETILKAIKPDLLIIDQ
uniref:Uncharacterized protein n=1 Tax=Panagrolaimus sp. JU765 TaxID=591449 RepID=A0AC34RJU4_9BILA